MQYFATEQFKYYGHMEVHHHHHHHLMVREEGERVHLAGNQYRTRAQFERRLTLIIRTMG